MIEQIQAIVTQAYEQATGRRLSYRDVRDECVYSPLTQDNSEDIFFNHVCTELGVRMTVYDYEGLELKTVQEFVQLLQTLMERAYDSYTTKQLRRTHEHLNLQQRYYPF